MLPDRTTNLDRSAAMNLGQLPLPALMARAVVRRDAAFGTNQTWSPKVFIPLTQLCRDLCHYCTFSRAREGQTPYLTADRVLEIAREGVAADCTEALFTLGDKPELRYPAAERALQEMGYATTIDYLEAMCQLVLQETGLVPHVNAGVLTRSEMLRLRAVSGSQGVMLETVADRLGDKGGPHYRSPDKVPAVRLEMMKDAGELAIPLTTGLLVGIGETREERIDTLLAIADLHRAHGHIQEVIVQNFRAKPRTPMEMANEPDLDELLWSIAMARMILPDDISIQAPPNLSDVAFPRLLEAGINDWGGISPVTPDHVNPERPWPTISRLETATEAAGYRLVPRLPAYPAFLGKGWQDVAPRRAMLLLADADGMARRERWAPGQPVTTAPIPAAGSASPPIARLLAQVEATGELSESDIVQLFRARGADVDHVCAAADALRRAENGDDVTFVVNRNINYTNICVHKCSFCAFSKGRSSEELRGPAYDLDLTEVARRTREASARGGTEVCMQGGIHPAYDGHTYLSLLRAAKEAVPHIHVHAFSPLEVRHGAQTLGLSVSDYLERLKLAGLGSLPGTAAEILDDEVRSVICPDKLDSAQWLETMEAAHRLGLHTTATIMFGHVDTPVHWARHLIAIRDLQCRTGGFTEFVPLPFVPMEAPMGLRGECRPGPTFREVRLMHAVARLALHPHIRSIQVSWVKLGAAGARACLEGGANDIGGTLMDESISRAAGARHGQEFAPAEMEAMIVAMGRRARQRTTLYDTVDAEVRLRGRTAAPLSPVVQTPPRKNSRRDSVNA